MTDFYMAQVEVVPEKEIRIVLPNGDSAIGTYQAKGPNYPINMRRVSRFKRDTRPGVVSSRVPGVPPASYPVIVFATADAGTQLWYYPPTEDGEAMREADYGFLFGKLVERCPKDNPLAQR